MPRSSMVELEMDTHSKEDTLVGQEFNLDSDSWQVEEVNANGHYIVEKCENGVYYMRNTDTDTEFITASDTMAYLITHQGDHIDDQFIYVGVVGCKYGDYRCFSIVPL